MQEEKNKLEGISYASKYFSSIITAGFDNLMQSFQVGEVAGIEAY